MNPEQTLKLPQLRKLSPDFTEIQNRTVSFFCPTVLRRMYKERRIINRYFSNRRVKNGFSLLVTIRKNLSGTIPLVYTILYCTVLYCTIQINIEPIKFFDSRSSGNLGGYSL